jgi:hypothetical protein
VLVCIDGAQEGFTATLLGSTPLFQDDIYMPLRLV